MAISGIGGATPEDPKKISGNEELEEQESQTEQKKGDKHVSVWDTNGDGVFSVQEQIDAIKAKADEDEAIKEAVKSGFDLDSLLKGIKDKSTDINYKSILSLKPENILENKLLFIHAKVAQFNFQKTFLNMQKSLENAQNTIAKIPDVFRKDK